MMGAFAVAVDALLLEVREGRRSSEGDNLRGRAVRNESVLRYRREKIAWKKRKLRVCKH